MARTETGAVALPSAGAGEERKAKMQAKGKDDKLTAHAQRTSALARMSRVPGVAPAAVLATIALLAVAFPAFATMYKWVDEKGVVHYSDQVPPEAINKNRVELNAQGVPIKKTDKALTPEQQRAKEQEEARARQIEKQQEEVARRDRALMSSYTTEKDIDLAKNRALQTIEAVIQSTEAYGAQLKTRNADAEAKKASYAGKPVPVALERELESIASELARNADIIARKKREAEAVTARYDADKQRWRELVATKGATEPQAAASVPVPVPAATGKPAAATPPAPASRK